VAMEVIRALAGHVDIRTTQIYVDVPTNARPTVSPCSNGVVIRLRYSDSARRGRAFVGLRGETLINEAT
jgi:hypothetical protein